MDKYVITLIRYCFNNNYNVIDKRSNPLLVNISRYCKVTLVCCLLHISSAYSQDEQEAKGIIGSMASLVYNTAWPTATYNEWEIKDVDIFNSGLDVDVKISGKSIIGTKLWLVMTFEFRNGGLDDLKLTDHNAIFIEPFTTTVLLAELTSELIEDSLSTPTTSYSSEGYDSYATRSIKFINTCQYPINIWIGYQDRYGNMTTDGVWSLEGYQKSYLTEDGLNISLSSSSIYYYAQIPGKNYSWHGNYSKMFNGNQYAMRKHQLSIGSDGNYEIEINCSNLSTIVPRESTPNKDLVIGIFGKDIESYRDMNNVVEVTEVLYGLPAFKSGIQKGDVLTHADGYNIENLDNLRNRIYKHDNRIIELDLVRGNEYFTIKLIPEVLPKRTPLDYKKCRKEGNPQDYFLGSIAVPYTYKGNFIVPRYPNTIGTLFDTDELDIFVSIKEPNKAFIFHSKPIRDDIVGFEYIDKDRVMVVRLESGEYLDLGVRVDCLIQPHLLKATEIRLSRTQNQEEVSYKILPVIITK